MRNGDEFVGQYGEVVNGPEEQVGNDEAAGDEDGLFAGEARRRIGIGY
jgi:hypothetical protein